MTRISKEVWVAAGLRTPFAKADKELKDIDAIKMSVIVLNKMNQSEGLNPDYVVWGTVLPNLDYSNIGREAILESELPEETIGLSTTLACSTSLTAAIQAALMISDDEVAIAGGVESMSNVQLGLSASTSRWLRTLPSQKGIFNKIIHFFSGLINFRLYIPKGVNRKTGKSMGQHAEITAQRLGVTREEQDRLALSSHENYFSAADGGFYEDLITPAFGLEKDAIPRRKTNLEKLATLKPVFDKKSGKGTLTAGNSSLFTDGAAGVWIAGKNKIGDINTPYKARLVDWEMAGVNIEKEGILMSPTFAIPKLLERHGLTYDDIDVWEIHEAFASQVLATIKNLEDPAHLKKTGVTMPLGKFPLQKLNMNGSSISIGHPFGATGARILSQTVKELHRLGPGKKALISTCADGGLGTIALVEN
jgi:acetyl-CoA C-acetyltransferase